MADLSSLTSDPKERLLLVRVDASHAHQPQLTATHREHHSASADFIISSSSTCSTAFRESLGVWPTGSSAEQTELHPILSLSIPSARSTLFKGDTFKPRHVASPESCLATHSYYFSNRRLLLFSPSFKLSFPPAAIPVDATPEATSFLPCARTHTPEGLIGLREKKGKEGKHNETGREVERKGREGKWEEAERLGGGGPWGELFILHPDT